MEGKRKAVDDTGGDNGDGGGASGYGGNTRSIGLLPRRPTTRRSFLPPFLEKTFNMVEDPETNSIISWSPNGFRKISSEKFEYAHPLFQAGKRDLLQHIQRKNQQCKYDSVIQPSCGSTDNLLKDRVEDELETLMIEQHGLKLELEKIYEKLGHHFTKIEEIQKLGEKREMIEQHGLKLEIEKIYEKLRNHLNKIEEIQKLREKREMSKYEANKNQELDNSTSKEISLELVAEGSCSRHTDKDEQVQEGVMEENDEDDSEHEEEYQTKAILKLPDLNAPNTLVQGENQETCY
nr:heat stress transcription factor A-9-like [Coffea arabica]